MLTSEAHGWDGLAKRNNKKLIEKRIKRMGYKKQVFKMEPKPSKFSHK